MTEWAIEWSIIEVDVPISQLYSLTGKDIMIRKSVRHDFDK